MGLVLRWLACSIALQPVAGLDLKVHGATGGKSGKGPAGKQSLFLLYLDAISVVNQQAAGRQAAAPEQVEQPNDHLPAAQATTFTLRDLQFIVKFAQVCCHPVRNMHMCKLSLWVSFSHCAWLYVKLALAAAAKGS